MPSILSIWSTDQYKFRFNGSAHKHLDQQAKKSYVGSMDQKLDQYTKSWINESKIRSWDQKLKQKIKISI